MTWQLARFAYVSWRFDEVSPGVVRGAAGLSAGRHGARRAVLTIALVDELVMVAMRGRPSFRAAEEAITVGKEGLAHVRWSSFRSFLLLLLFAILASGVWIAMALAIVGFVAIMTTVSTPPGQVLATSIWAASSSWDLTALPMFIWMGEILYRTKLPDDMFTGLAPWMQKLPGRLLHVNVVGCAIFAAVSGSSAATCATIGRIAMPELLKRGYDEKMAIGTLAGSGTLGLLIPPSIILIIYATVTEQSIARLFIAGVIPGIMLAGLFMGFIMVWALLNKDRMPPPEPAMPFRERLVASRRLIPVMLLILGVIGSIYGGLASATEAAVVGVFLSLAFSWWSGTLNQESFPRGAAGGDAHELHDRLHPGGRGLSHRRDGFYRHSDGAGRMDRRLQSAALGAAHAR